MDAVARAVAIAAPDAFEGKKPVALVARTRGFERIGKHARCRASQAVQFAETPVVRRPVVRGKKHALVPDASQRLGEPFEVAFSAPAGRIAATDEADFH